MTLGQTIRIWQLRIALPEKKNGVMMGLTGSRQCLCRATDLRLAGDSGSPDWRYGN